MDTLVQICLMFVLVMGASLFEAVGLAGVGMGGMLVSLFFIQWFYGAFFGTILAGRTPGKWALKLRVVTASGAPATIPQYVLRNLPKGADFLPFGYGIGGLVMTLDTRLRRIGDLVAGTVVVDETSGSLLGDVPIHPPVTEEERRALPARVDLTRDEVSAVETLLRRRPRLADERAEELAELLAPMVSETTGVEAETSERVLVLAYARATGRDRALEDA